MSTFSLHVRTRARTHTHLHITQIHINHTHIHYINNNKIKMRKFVKMQLKIGPRAVDEQQKARAVEMTREKDKKCREK